MVDIAPQLGSVPTLVSHGNIKTQSACNAMNGDTTMGHIIAGIFAERINGDSVNGGGGKRSTIRGTHNPGTKEEVNPFQWVILRPTPVFFYT